MKLLFLTLISLFTIAINAKPCTEIPYSASFIAGQYTLIGREPASEKTYTGKMQIESVGDQKVRFVESIDKQSPRIWLGQFRAASPGEGCVLEVESKQARMSCLIAVDLDNYARLS